MKPVNVYLKKHNITGKLYFGKTTKNNLETYKGSGKRWIRHYKKHGTNEIENVFVYTFYNETELVDFCEFFSDFYDIVKSTKFLNLIPENGLDGGDTKYMYYISKSGDKIKHLKGDDPNNLYDAGYVPVQSNEGRIRRGINSIHKNKNTISVLCINTLETKRIHKEEFSELLHIKSGSKIYYETLNKPIPKRPQPMVKAITQNKDIINLTLDEFNSRSDVCSVYSKKGKELLGDHSNGNRKGKITCIDKYGKLCSVNVHDFWQQLIEFGPARTEWPFVHHSSLEGANRKLLGK